MTGTACPCNRQRKTAHGRTTFIWRKMACSGNFAAGGRLFRRKRLKGSSGKERTVFFLSRTRTAGRTASPSIISMKTGCIYMHCGKEGHKIDCLKHDERASFCVVGRSVINAPKLSTDFQSVICFGRVSSVTGEAERKDIVRRFSLHLAPETTEEALEKEFSIFGRNLIILKLKIEHVTGKEGKYLSLARKKAAK